MQRKANTKRQRQALDFGRPATGKPQATHPGVHCRECGAGLNPAGALPRDDRLVLCLKCLAAWPEASPAVRLKACRIAGGLTLTELAKRAGISVKTLSGYECRTKRPAPETLARLLAATGIPQGEPPAADDTED